MWCWTELKTEFAAVTVFSHLFTGQEWGWQRWCSRVKEVTLETIQNEWIHITAKAALFASGEVRAASVLVLGGFLSTKMVCCVPGEATHCREGWWLWAALTPSFALSNSTAVPGVKGIVYHSSWPHFPSCWIRHFNKSKWCVFYRESFETEQDCCTLFKASFQEELN